jgi:DNA repair protein RecN (Recombination protein N)
MARAGRRRVRRLVIEEISIRNLGVIGDARLPLGPGFTALTGETGAGKTMVVTALGLLLGQRSDSSVLRQGTDAAIVEGHWLIDPTGAVADRVRDAGGDMDGGELILGRSISQEGRSRAIVGGRTTPVSVLGEIGQQLVVVHGQSDQVRLRSATAQREALDRFAGNGLAALIGHYQDSYRRWQSNQGELEVLVAERQRRSLEAEQLRVAMTEIEAVAPRRGEDAELVERAERLTNLEDLRLAAAEAHELISSESLEGASDVIGLLETARRLLERASEHDPALVPIGESIVSAGILVSEVSVQLSSYLGSLDADGARELELVQQRRAELAAVTRRFGPSLDETIDYLDSGSRRLLELDNDSDRIDALTGEVEADRARVIELAAQLTSMRVTAAEALSARVTAELSALAMPDASIVVTVTDRPEYSQSGKDSVSILFAPHAGADIHLRRGGCRSRWGIRDRDRSSPCPARPHCPGDRRHPPCPGRRLLDQSSPRRERQLRKRDDVERAAVDRRGPHHRDGTAALRTTRFRQRTGPRARADRDSAGPRRVTSVGIHRPIVS